MELAKLVLHHDDPPCTKRLRKDGFCVECNLHPDMQSTCFYYYCPKCDLKLKDMRCVSCKLEFGRSQKKKAVMSKMELLGFLRRLEIFMGNLSRSYQFGARQLSGLVGVICESDTPFHAIDSLSGVSNVCNQLMGEISGNSSDRVRRSMSHLPLISCLKDWGLEDITIAECAAILKILPGLAQDKPFQVNDSGTNFQYHVINLGFGKLITSEFKVLGKPFLELMDWVLNKLLEIDQEITSIYAVSSELEKSKILFAGRVSGLMFLVNDLGQKLFDFYRLLDFLVTEPGVTVKEAFSCVNDVD